MEIFYLMVKIGLIKKEKISHEGTNIMLTNKREKV